MLNAFRHHGERHWTGEDVHGARWEVLNAFRHHGERHRPGHGAGRVGCRGAQRLPASRRAAPGDRDTLRIAHRRVLNAFRHHGERHSLELTQRPGWPASSAQRLPASRRAALNPARSTAPVPECSTPSGITASGTPRPWTTPGATSPSAQRLPASRRAARQGPGLRPERPRRVLNAFRHHGERHAKALDYARSDLAECSTPSGITASGTYEPVKGTMAFSWVLNAFRHHGERHSRLVSHAVGGSTCSTPSGITASGTHPFRHDGEGQTHVLNAFRHHGERHRTRRLRPDCRGHVLNAFRHHGERHPPRAGWRPPGAGVLNAFRHHGERHVNQLHRVSKSVVRCSTPSGITASGTGGRKCKSGLSIVCAQRLPASRRAAPHAVTFKHRKVRVLNAFRHHGERHRTRFSVFTARPNCAQRLPASRRAAQQTME
ncbi:hypothetical protein SAMN05444383_10168 [Myxococcus xanthus]|nr:hypothetical protein SAMN05444383_10168 [Myxococcus xanthus]